MPTPPRSATRPSIPLIAVALVLAAGAAASVLLNWPGQFSPDSVWQLQQGRVGIYNSWHPPVMAWLLGLFDRMSPGAGGFILFDAALGYGALMAFAALSSRPRGIAVAVAAAMAASPLMLLYQGDVWKDVLFADASVAGFAALAWSARLWPRPALRHGLAAMAFVLFALACLVRQNGLLIPLWGAAGFAAIAWRQGLRPLAALAQGLAALAACLVLALAGAAALAARSDGEPAQAEQVEWVQAWDLAGAVRLEPGLDLGVLERDAPDAADLVRGFARVWTPVRIDSLVLYPGAQDALDDAGPPVGRQWRRLILEHPLLYARVRLAVLGQIVATPDLMACRPLFVGLDAPPGMLKALKLAPRHRPKDAWARRYGLAFVGGPALSHLAYGGLAVIIAALAVRDLRRAGPTDLIVVIALISAAFTFAASFLVVGLACDYRYLYLADLAAMAALIHRAAAPPVRTADAP